MGVSSAIMGAWGFMQTESLLRGKTIIVRLRYKMPLIQANCHDLRM
jgi:hypothetical protein